MTKHGMSRSRTYITWSNMMNRCTRTANNRFKDYGGRGIKVCDRWLEFLNFYKDMGDRARGYSIERINNDGDYCPENCRWIPMADQQRNTRTTKHITFRGETRCIADWARELGLTEAALRYRLASQAWTFDTAMSTRKMVGTKGESRSERILRRTLKRKALQLN